MKVVLARSLGNSRCMLSTQYLNGCLGIMNRIKIPSAWSYNLLIDVKTTQRSVVYEYEE